MAEQLAIEDLQVDLKQIPLKQPFVTALHRVDAVNAVRVTVRLANGVTGTGSCTPNEKVTGDTIASARAVIEETIKPLILGKNLTDWKELLATVKNSIVHNGPAKAAVEIALYNTRANLFGLTLPQLLGGKGGSVETDYTISIGKAEQMIADAQKMVDQGFKSLKLKLGAGHLKRDIKLVEDLAYAAGPMVHLRLDMNQAWDARQTMQAAEYWHKQGLLIDFIEQPVAAWDLDAMAYLTRHCPYPIMADESV
ncbi:dipeptide epimerase, partial [Lactobacillus nasalidis]